MMQLDEGMGNRRHQQGAYSVPQKTSWCFLIGFILLIFVLSGCSDNEQKPAVAFDKPLYTWGTITGQTLTIRGNRADLHRPYMLKALKRYETLTGNTVRLEAMNHEELVHSLNAAFVEKTAPQPDLVFSPGGTAIEYLDPETSFCDLTNEPWVNDLTDTSINLSIYNAKVIGLPHSEASVSGTLYNKTLFVKLGLHVPRTQAEFLQVCETLLQNGVIPLYLPYAEPSMMLYQFPMDSVMHNPTTLEGLNNGSLSYTALPEMKTIVSWYKTLADRGYLGQDYIHNDWAGMDQAMHSGRYAMMLCWDTWLYTDFTGDPRHFGLMPAFMGVPEEGTFEGPNQMLLMVNKHSPRMEAGLDLLTFLADPFNYNVAFAGIYTAPVFKNQVGSLSTPQYMWAEPLIEKLFFDSITWLHLRGFSQLDAVFIQQHMQNSMYTVEDCLKDMDASRIKRIQGSRVDR